MTDLLNKTITFLNQYGESFWNFGAAMFVQICILVTILVLVDYFIRNKIRSVIRYWLWSLVLLKLVLPVTLYSPASVAYWLTDYFPTVSVASDSDLIVQSAYKKSSIPINGNENLGFTDPFMTEGAGHRLNPFSDVPTGSTVAAVPPKNISIADTKKTISVPLQKLQPKAIILIAWLSIVIILFGLVVHRSRRVRKLTRNAATAPVELINLMDDCCRLLGVRQQSVQLKISDQLGSPAICGLRNPTILLPRHLIDKLEPEQFRLILVHELAHWKRYDLHVNCLQTFLHILYFYNPMIWIANIILRRLREQAVDETVLFTFKGKSQQYSSTLLDIVALKRFPTDLSLQMIGIIEPRNPLIHRMQRIVTRPIPGSAKLGTVGLLMIALFGVVLLPMSGANRSHALENAAVKNINTEKTDTKKTNTKVEEKKDKPIKIALKEPGKKKKNQNKPAKSESEPEISADLKDLIKKVRENEALFANLDTTIKTLQVFKIAQDDENGGGFGSFILSSIGKNHRAVTQGDQFFFSGELSIGLTTGEERTEKQTVVFDGTNTVAIAEKNSSTLFHGRHEPALMLPPHCLGMFTLRVNFPLSVYLGGTSALMSHPKVQRHPTETGSTYEFNKVECEIVGREKIENLDCVKVKVRRWHYTKEPPMIQYLWLAKDRNYHVVQVKTAFLRKGKEVAREESLVSKWKQLAEGIWLPLAVESQSHPVEFSIISNLIHTLQVERVQFNPKLPDDIFKVPEIPVSLPSFVVSKDREMVGSPQHPKPIERDVDTTLDSILQRLAKEEARYISFDIVNNERYEHLGPMIGSGGFYVTTESRERSLLKGKKSYYTQEKNIKRDNGEKSLIVLRQAYDGQRYRETHEYHHGVNQSKLQFNATIAPIVPKEMGLLRAHNMAFQWDRYHQPVSQVLRSGRYNSSNKDKMKVEYVGDERVGNLHCHKLKCSFSSSEIPIYNNYFFIWLARDRNLIPIRHEWHEPRWNAKIPTGIKYAKDLQEIRPGLWFPYQATHLAFRKISGDGLSANRPLLQLRRDIQVESLTLNPEVDEKLFSQVEVPKGTKVLVKDEQGNYLGTFKQEKTGNIEITPEELLELRQKTDTKVKKKKDKPIKIALKEVVPENVTNGNETRTEQPDKTKVSATETEFIFNDEKGKPIPKGIIKVTGSTDKGRYFSNKIPIKQGRATMKFKRPKLASLTVKIDSPGFQTYLKVYKVKGTDRGFPVARQYTYQLERGITIGGTVLDEGGKPLKGVRINYSSINNERNEDGRSVTEGWLTTGTDGKWSTSDVAPDMSLLRLHFEHATHVHELSEVKYAYTPTPEESNRLRAQTYIQKMTLDSQVVGKVVDPNGNPLSGVMVLQASRRNYFVDYGKGLIPKTDKKGEFRLSKQKSGKHKVTFFSKDWGLKTLKIKIPLKKPLRITLQKGHRLEFRTVDESGKPIAGITFHPEASRTTPNKNDSKLSYPHVLDFLSHRNLIDNKSDENGLFVWENAPAERLHYQIISSKYLSQLPNADYSPDDSPVTLTFRKRIPVIGKVVDADTGKPIRDFRLYNGVHFKSNRPGKWSWNQQRVFSGRAAKETPLEPGQFKTRLYAVDRLYQYRIQADGYLPQFSKKLDAAILTDKQINLEFRLKKNVETYRTVFTVDGKPAENARVAIKIGRRGNGNRLGVVNGIPDEAEYQAASSIVRTDKKGQFKLPIFNDPFICAITHESGYLEINDLNLAKQGELKLNPWASVEGTIFIKGKPAAGVKITSRLRSFFLNNDDEFPAVYFSQSTTTDESGKFRLSKGVTGIWLMGIILESPDQQEKDVQVYPRPVPPWTNSFTIKLASGETTHQDIGRVGADVIGRIIIPKGVKNEWKSSHLQLVRELKKDKRELAGQDIYQTQIQEDGTFRCFNLRPGLYKGSALIGIGVKRRFYNLAVSLEQNGENKILLTEETFKGKSFSNPINLGDLKIEQVETD